jgi:predicted helicase
MCASVEDVLKAEFGLGLGDAGVNILDPCTGTGNFVVNLIRRIPKRDLPRVYREQLFANEVMLLPYYIAAMNIEHVYYERTGNYEPFEGICFVDTLGLAEGEQKQLAFMSEKNTERVDREKRARINIIIGNPPYNFGQLNENDNNKNRKYEVVDQRVRESYSASSKATLKNSLFGPFVKFIRWATDRIGQEDGIVCLVTNNAFIDNITFDGMRKHLLGDFDTVYHLDLRGNVRQNPKLSGSAYNVFGIQVGVGITLAVRRSGTSERRLRFHRLALDLRRQAKLSWLAERESIKHVQWNDLEPDAKNRWLVPSQASLFATFIAFGDRETKGSPSESPDILCTTYSCGVKTNRDEAVYDFDGNVLAERIDRFIDDYNLEVYRYKKQLIKGPIDVDQFVDYSKLKWDGTLKSHLTRQIELAFQETKVRDALYRPFTRVSLYFETRLINRVYLFDHFFPNPESEKENKVICVTDVGSEKPFMALISNRIVDLHIVGAGASSQCFLYHIYDEDGSNRRDNITASALEAFRGQYRNPKIAKWDIFHYVYGVLHHPGYRTRFADNLRRELPRIPFMDDFRVFADAGKKLAELHLNYETLEPWPLEWVENPDLPLSYRVEKMKLSKDKASLRVNDSLALDGIPPEGFSYRLGNRSALEWVIDQHQVKQITGPGGERVSDPNRPDDPEYIIRLVGQVVRVSIETVKIVGALPAAFGWIEDSTDVGFDFQRSDKIDEDGAK